VLCCAVVVAKQGSASTVAIGSAAPLVITVAWSQFNRKAGGGGGWEKLGDQLLGGASNVAVPAAKP
jgi:hypothetical protein